MRVVVIGASGGAGRAIAAELAERGHRVTGVSRGGPPVPLVEERHADVEDADGAVAAVAGADTVVMAAQPPYHEWPDRFPAMLGHVIEATSREDARLVMVDNLYAYGPGPGPITEETPHRATDRKGRTRAAMVATLLDAHHSGRVRVAIGQASDYIGPAGTASAITALAVDPVAAGASKARWLGRLDRAHAVAYLPDLARAYARLVEDERSDGSAWILPHAGEPTGEEFVDQLAAASGRTVTASAVSKTMLRLAAPFDRSARESLGIAYQWTEPWRVDWSRFDATFGPLAVTSMDEAVERALEGAGTGAGVAD